MIAQERTRETNRWKMPPRGGFLPADKRLPSRYDELRFTDPVVYPHDSGLVNVNPDAPPVVRVPRVDIVRTVKHMGMIHGLGQVNRTAGFAAHLTAGLASGAIAAGGIFALRAKAPLGWKIAAGVGTAFFGLNALTSLFNAAAYALGAETAVAPTIDLHKGAWL